MHAHCCSGSGLQCQAAWLAALGEPLGCPRCPVALSSSRRMVCECLPCHISKRMHLQSPLAVGAWLSCWALQILGRPVWAAQRGPGAWAGCPAAAAPRQQLFWTGPLRPEPQALPHPSDLQAILRRVNFSSTAAVSTCWVLLGPHKKSFSRKEILWNIHSLGGCSIRKHQL